MDNRTLLRLTAVTLVCGTLVSALAQATALHAREHGQSIQKFDDVIHNFAQAELERGRQTFRYDTFGDEAWWGDVLQLHRAIEGARHGGVGPGVSPATARRRRP